MCTVFAAFDHIFRACAIHLFLFPFLIFIYSSLIQYIPKSLLIWKRFDFFKENISHRASTPDKELIMGSYGMLRMLPGLPQERSLNWLSNTRWAHWNCKHTGSVLWTEQVVFCICHGGVGGMCITMTEERLWVWERVKVHGRSWKERGNNVVSKNKKLR